MPTLTWEDDQNVNKYWFKKINRDNFILRSQYLFKESENTSYAIITINYVIYTVKVTIIATLNCVRVPYSDKRKHSNQNLRKWCF